jgi:apolipoprotein N-acyltransferase
MIIGASTFKHYEPGERLSATVRKYKNGNGHYDAFNTAFVIDSTAGIGYYHKSKLVPGPEKLPFPQMLRPFQEFAFDLGGTVGSLGLSPERTVFTNSSNGIKYSAVVCYESIYGEFMAQFVRNGAELLFIITNDGWWGHTDGHRQHFSFAILRAIETRRCIARSANTGISGFVNQRGDIMQQTPYWQQAAISQTLLAQSELTFYTKHGDYLGRLALFTSGLFVLLTLVMGLLNRKKGRL